MTDRCTVFYVTGLSHSGTTLVSALLGGHSAIQYLGEVDRFDELVLSAGSSGRQCSCGLAAESCPHWKNVIEQVLSCGPGSFSLKTGSPEEVQRSNELFFSVARKVFNKDVFVDSSKRTARLDCLLQSEQLRIFIVHIVRDPRAVAYSMVRKRERTGEKLADPHAPLNSWKQLNRRLIENYGSEPNYMRLRYEDLVSKPEFEVRRLLQLADLSLEEEQLRVYGRHYHVFAGNRMLRRDGPIEVRWDREYIDSLTSSDWNDFTDSVSALLPVFGYPEEREAVGLEFSRIEE